MKVSRPRVPTGPELRPPPYCSREKAHEEEISGLTSDEISCYGKTCFCRGKTCQQGWFWHQNSLYVSLSKCDGFLQHWKQHRLNIIIIIIVLHELLALFHVIIYSVCLWLPLNPSVRLQPRGYLVSRQQPSLKRSAWVPSFWADMHAGEPFPPVEHFRHPCRYTGVIMLTIFRNTFQYLLQTKRRPLHNVLISKHNILNSPSPRSRWQLNLQHVPLNSLPSYINWIYLFIFNSYWSSV